MYRHLIEAHETSREADDTVLWQMADLASRRLRQVHGIRYADDPDRATELLGPVLAGGSPSTGAIVTSPTTAPALHRGPARRRRYAGSRSCDDPIGSRTPARQAAAVLDPGRTRS